MLLQDKGLAGRDYLRLPLPNFLLDEPFCLEHEARSFPMNLGVHGH